MILGEVNARLEAIIPARIKGSDGAEVTIDVIVDTGFSDYLTLSTTLVDELGLSRQDTTTVRLADGSLRDVYVVQGSVWWNDEWHRIPIRVSDGDPLLGMSLLRGHFLSVEVIEQGEVTIDPPS